MSKDTLGDRMKLYERIGAADRLMPMLPVVCRMDGKAFHSFTRGLKRPYDERLSQLMVEVTTALVKLTNAKTGYTQSDEITLIIFSEHEESQIFFDGRRDKMVSLLAAYATLWFNRMLSDYLPEKAKCEPVFDARVFTVPSKTEAVNALIWREKDATRNSISMAAQACFSHKSLHGMPCDEMQERLFQEKGINWNDYPAFFKRGTYVRSRLVSRPFTTDELDALPPKHNARKNPELVIERHEIYKLDLPVLTKVMNREAVVFDGAEPLIIGQDSRDSQSETISVAQDAPRIAPTGRVEG